MWRHTAEHQESGVLYLHEDPSAMNSISSVVSARWLEMRVNGCPWSGQDDKGTGPRRAGQGDLDLAKVKLCRSRANSGLDRRLGGLDSKQQLLWLGTSFQVILQLRRQLPQSANQMNAFHQPPPPEFSPTAGMSISLCSLR